MSDYDMKIHSNPDAQAWAKFFIHTKEKANWQIEDIDESLMLAWFANAMMAMHDYLKSQRTWVDLTRTQMQDVYFEVLKEHRGGHQIQGQLAFGEALQAKLKEKNGA
jgi:hypothetical protein